MPGESPPAHLSDEMQAWYRQIAGDYELQSHHYRLLQAACEAWDRMQEARRILQRDGVCLYLKSGRVVKHPAVSVEENARLQFARLVRELALEEEAPIESPPPRLAYAG